MTFPMSKDDSLNASVFKHIIRGSKIGINNKLFLNLTNKDYSFNPHGNNYNFYFKNKEIIFIINHGGGLKTRLLTPSPIIFNSDEGIESRLTSESYINLLKLKLAGEINISKHIIFLAVCYAAEKSIITNKSLACEISRELGVPVIASDNVVEVLSYFPFAKSEKIVNSAEKEYIQDITTKGKWFLIEPSGLKNPLSFNNEQLFRI